MQPLVTVAPLLRWDGVHLVLELDRVDRALRRHLVALDQVRDLALSGQGDAIRVTATVTYRGVAARVEVDVAEIRLKHRHLGFRLRRPRALGGVPVPRRLIERVLGHLELDGITLVHGEGIVVVDLRRWLPPQLELSIRTVQATDRAVHIWVGPGSFADLPGSEPLALAAGPPSPAPP
jgi:hypothetical protein